jgi:hypothetical protein
MDYEEHMENARYATNDETALVYEPKIDLRKIVLQEVGGNHF